MGGITTALIGSFAGIGPRRYFILQPIAVRSSGQYLQLSEFNIMNGATRISPATYSNWNLSFSPAGSLADTPTSPANETPALANDGNVNTKWLDFRGAGGGLLIDLGSQQTSTGYQWYTANDSNGRDLSSWKVWSSNDLTTWRLMSDVSGFSATTTRLAFAGSWNWT